MPPQTLKAVLKDALEDLTEEDFDKFCHQLVDRRAEPRVLRSRVEGKSFLQVADVLVSTFTESRALLVAADILRQIGCNDEAQRLAETGSFVWPDAGAEDVARDGLNRRKQKVFYLLSLLCLLCLLFNSFIKSHGVNMLSKIEVCPGESSVWQLQQKVAEQQNKIEKQSDEITEMQRQIDAIRKIPGTNAVVPEMNRIITEISKIVEMTSRIGEMKSHRRDE